MNWTRWLIEKSKLHHEDGIVKMGIVEFAGGGSDVMVISAFGWRHEI
jgi:hypothetical protein